jgi:hypothetical protein
MSGHAIRSCERRPTIKPADLELIFSKRDSYAGMSGLIAGTEMPSLL